MASRHPLAVVLKSGLLKANESDKDIQRAMEAATIKEVPRVTKRISYLSMLANIATLLGLLGTQPGRRQIRAGLLHGGFGGKHAQVSRAEFLQRTIVRAERRAFA